MFIFCRRVLYLYWLKWHIFCSIHHLIGLLYLSRSFSAHLPQHWVDCGGHLKLRQSQKLHSSFSANPASRLFACMSSPTARNHSLTASKFRALIYPLAPLFVPAALYRLLSHFSATVQSLSNFFLTPCFVIQLIWNLIKKSKC